MKQKICFIFRKFADTPSIERVFTTLEAEFERLGIEVIRSYLPYGNGLGGTIANLLLFRPPPADIYHITGHIHYIAIRLHPDRAILTVHDLGILRSRKGLRRRIIEKLYFDWPFRRLRSVTAISNATKSDILEHFPSASGKVVVVYDPLDPRMTADDKRTFNRDRPTVLIVGTATHKNLERVIDALAPLSYPLIVVGTVSDEQRQRLDEAKLEYEITIATTDEEMRAIYARADILAFCSTFEGFGLPIIEAQSMGVPVITSNLAPMSEVGGDGALLVDPLNVDAIRNALHSVVNDAILRSRLINNGRANLQRFDPKAIAREYLELYEKL